MIRGIFLTVCADTALLWDFLPRKTVIVSEVDNVQGGSSMEKKLDF